MLRRAFLKTVSAGVSAVALPTLAGATMGTDKLYGFMCLGTGPMRGACWDSCPCWLSTDVPTTITFLQFRDAETLAQARRWWFADVEPVQRTRGAHHPQWRTQVRRRWCAELDQRQAKQPDLWRDLYAIDRNPGSSVATHKNIYWLDRQLPFVFTGSYLPTVVEEAFWHDELLGQMEHMPRLTPHHQYAQRVFEVHAIDRFEGTL